jgi:S-adenosylmethionine synthetase
MTMRLITSESVTEGHPDKVADAIADEILDELMRKDPRARVAVEVLLTASMAFVAGEVTTEAYADILSITRRVIREIGYTDPAYGFHWDDVTAVTAIREQSREIARKVDPHVTGKGGRITRERLARLGAGDQGLMFGYAATETAELMPLPITLAHRLAVRLAEVRKQGIVKGLRPDGKSQVTLRYDDFRPVAVDSVVLAAHHDPDKPLRKLQEELTQTVIKPVLRRYPELSTRATRFLVNARGSFVEGGPQADTGLTGRKNIVDTYGGAARHGGGSLSGKDPTKVDRTGQYAARWVAKTVVAARLATRCEVQVSYVIGRPEPTSVDVDTFGTGRVPDERIGRALLDVFDLRPGILIRDLDLRRPIYRQVSCYGHFGRPELRLPWESTTRVAALLRAIR